MADDLNIPIPDPSLLTTRQLRWEVTALRELVESRLDAMDKATALLRDDVTRTPSDSEKAVNHLTSVVDERFKSVEKQFHERDIRADASEKSATVAVSAALQAAKEAAGKSEVSTEKQIEGIKLLLAGNKDTLDEKIASITSRLDRGEGSGTGKANSQHTMLAVAALAVSILIGGAAFFTGKHSDPPTPSVVYQSK